MTKNKKDNTIHRLDEEIDPRPIKQPLKVDIVALQDSICKCIKFCHEESMKFSPENDAVIMTILCSIVATQIVHSSSCREEAQFTAKGFVKSIGKALNYALDRIESGE